MACSVLAVIHNMTSSAPLILVVSRLDSCSPSAPHSTAEQIYTHSDALISERSSGNTLIIAV